MACPRKLAIHKFPWREAVKPETLHPARRQCQAENKKEKPLALSRGALLHSIHSIQSVAVSLHLGRNTVKRYRSRVGPRFRTSAHSPTPGNPVAGTLPAFPSHRKSRRACSPHRDRSPPCGLAMRGKHHSSSSAVSASMVSPPSPKISQGTRDKTARPRGRARAFPSAAGTA